MHNKFYMKLKKRSEKLQLRYRFLCNAIISLANKNRGVEQELSDAIGDSAWSSCVSEIKPEKKQGAATVNISHYQRAFQELYDIIEIVECDLPDNANFTLKKPSPFYQDNVESQTYLQ